MHGHLNFILAEVIVVLQSSQKKFLDSTYCCGFGGLGVACWPLVPKFAGSNPAEVVGFLGRKIPQHAFLRRGSKSVGPMS